MQLMAARLFKVQHMVMDKRFQSRFSESLCLQLTQLTCMGLWLQAFMAAQLLRAW